MDSARHGCVDVRVALGSSGCIIAVDMGQIHSWVFLFSWFLLVFSFFPFRIFSYYPFFVTSSG
jgi:hypothetical protein